MDTRNTKQKDIIFNILKENRIHPTIQEIYQKVKEYDSSIGQATVYRNVNKLVEDGKLIRIPTSNDGFRYDIDCVPHYHLICKKCGRIFDLYDDSYCKMVKNVESKYSIEVSNVTILFDGICKDCNEKIGFVSNKNMI